MSRKNREGVGEEERMRKRITGEEMILILEK